MPVFTFDIVLIVIIVVGAFIGLHRGFVRSVAGLLEYIIAFMIANRFYVNGAVLCERLPFIANMKTDIEMPVIDAEKGFFGRVGAIVSYIISSTSQSGANIDETTHAVMNNYIAELISKAMAFVIIFILSLLLMKLIVFIIDKFCDLPVFNVTNKALGLLFGILCGMAATWIISNLFVNTILPMLVANHPETFSLEMGQTVLMKIFTKYSPAALIMYAANWLSSLGVKI